MDANANIIKRFVIYMAILTFIMFTVWGFVKSFMNRPPGDYETEVCDNRLKDKLYENKYVMIYVLIILIIMIINLILSFRRVKMISAYLMIPYLLWCCFALILNTSLIILN